MANLTQANDGDVTAFLDSIPDERRRAEGHAIRHLMEEVTGAPAQLWGTAIVGFGSQPYTNTSGTHEWFVLGFSPRKAAITLYGVYDDYAPANPLFADLGPHTTGKGCLYLKRLDRVDLDVLKRLVRDAWNGADREGR
jgi:hypothetical protein